MEAHMAPDKEFDAWAGEEGLPDKFDGTLTDCRFGYEATYLNGQQELFQATIKCDDPEVATDGEVKVMMSIGKGWEIKDRGLKVVRADGGQKGFIKSSAYFDFFTSAVNSGADAKAAILARGTPMEAGTFEGLRFHFARVERDYGGEIGKKSRLVPVKFLGEVGGKTTATTRVSGGAAAAKAKAAAKQQAAESTSNGHAPGGVDEALWATLVDMATKADSHENFMEAAYELDGIDGGAVEEFVISTGAGSVWAAAGK